ncbi:mitochondrial inner membrane protease ATP23 homolog isoform X3 [Belonocnema kinseyi]|uniref:mitochondrial inner membrane protease ATP23 homolog isoform X3 n=1 Tax=Belonocnema kinseyi TaxID=2817044 RepID=UPI00143D55AE|nr:mitochondrial inner membrane protease ATP23 homolog isoform X3 [Belonocnema kinseyi]
MKNESGKEENKEKLNDLPKDLADEDKSLWGYDLYPERRGAKYKPSLINTMLGIEGREDINRIKCERNVYNVFHSSPLVKLMAAALKSSGCEFDIRRHVCCEVCDYSVSGGYDPILNQIVVCQNVARGKGMIQGVMTHEMIHMFDYCRNELDFKNIDHLACTEVRAANLAHCSFLSAWSQGNASLFKIKDAHQLQPTSYWLLASERINQLFSLKDASLPIKWWEPVKFFLILRQTGSIHLRSLAINGSLLYLVYKILTLTEGESLHHL